MCRIELWIPLPAGAYPVAHRGRLTPHGTLLRERVASMACDWPAVGFQRIEPDRGSLRVVVGTEIDVPPAVIAAALICAIRRETSDLVSWNGNGNEND